jgi:hypothetical protein
LGATLATIRRRLAKVGMVTLAAIGPSTACGNTNCATAAGILDGGVQVTAVPSVARDATWVTVCASDRCLAYTDSRYAWRPGNFYPFPFTRKELLVDERFNVLAVGHKLSIRVVLEDAFGSKLADGTTEAALHYIKRGAGTEPRVAFAVELTTPSTLREVKPSLS